MILSASLIFKAFFLGVVEGLTEFIPVSSTGHLVLFGELIKFHPHNNVLFYVVIQLGAILAVLVIYFKHLTKKLVGTFFCKKDQYFSLAIILATMPAIIVGFTLYNKIVNILFTPWTIVITLIFGGFCIIFVEYRLNKVKGVSAKRGNDKEEKEKEIDIKPTTAFKVGLYQCLALIPGVSRSGSSIIGGMLSGLSRSSATEFSFFLAIPLTMGAVILDTWKLRHTILISDVELMTIGFCTAFFSALLVCLWLIRYVRHHTFIPFGIWRIVFGVIMALWLFFGQH